ncbi:hypothetical protein JZ751_005743 [Albula glossodonta]|uniref:NXPE C-terminal domain-containing protein n=1 Tax=Albula glossodonta TaxID=121402 RepID=A0A8T2NBC7_9TELE|nr:hypothetical protein JZ751_005743 [Albula glossodonta]
MQVYSQRAVMTTQLQRPTENCVPGTKSPFPSGYFYGDKWFSTVCKLTPFLSRGVIDQCLKGKRVYIWGSVYIARDLDSLEVGGGKRNAVIIGIGQHFRAFPLEYFIHRLLNIRRAILRLQARSPETMVFIKLENTREFTSPILRLSDTYGHLQNLAQRKVFKGMRVVIVDAWDISVAANTFSTHPKELVVSNQVSLVLSHFCFDL